MHITPGSGAILGFICSFVGALMPAKATKANLVRKKLARSSRRHGLACLDLALLNNVQVVHDGSLYVRLRTGGCDSVAVQLYKAHNMCIALHVESL